MFIETRSDYDPIALLSGAQKPYSTPSGSEGIQPLAQQRMTGIRPGQHPLATARGTVTILRSSTPTHSSAPSNS
jgi:hypothetical protein